MNQTNENRDNINNNTDEINQKEEVEKKEENVENQENIINGKEKESNDNEKQNNEEEENKSNGPNINNLTVEKLKEELKNKGIDFPKNAKKKELQDLLINSNK
jgi:hypothetical protein